MVLLLIAAAVPVTALAPAPAQAQQYRKDQRRGLFDFLFGGGQREPAVQRRSQPSPARQAPARTRSRSSATSAPVRRAPPAVEKLENARKVLVVGDFLAGGLAEGLEAAYAESPGVRFIDASNGSSGFVRDDYYDWNAELPRLLDEENPSIVVVMIGSNDRQQLLVDGQREPPRSDAWLNVYKARVERFAATISERDIPFVWTGLPSFKPSSMSSDMLAFNDIYKSTAETANGTFVDIWDGFVDENGAFVFTGPDMNGQPARLRGSDGINLSRAGKRKIAFYVEKPLNKLLGQAASPDIGEIGLEGLPDLVLTPSAPTPVDRTSPISLADPSLDGGTELLGAVVKPIGKQPVGTQDQPAAPVNRQGRADDFSLTQGDAEKAAPVSTP